MTPSRTPRKIALAFLALAGGLALAGPLPGAVIDVESTDARARFAQAEIESALRVRHDAGADQNRLVLTVESAATKRLNDEAFRIEVSGRGADRVIHIIGGGAGGLMYGGLEVAEQIRIGGLGSVQPMERTPYIAMRGAKFNLPLDVRTPSYTDMGDSAQANIATVWDFSFWQEYLDHLARDRFNFVSLWNLHPFPSLVHVPDYPDVALADVQRTTIPFAENYSTRTEDIVTPAMLAHTETVKRLTMREKIEFWRRVMQYAHDRNIDVYIVTWNIYTYGAAGKHGITDDITNPVTIDYFRKSVAELFRTYPLLRGIGVTAGENMGSANASFEAKENWLFETYGRGVLDVAREQPGRAIRFIHRQHETRAADIARTFAPLTQVPGVDFVFSFKYAQAHAQSSTTQPFHREFVASLAGLKTLWTLRNDDALVLRWAAPDFVREFITRMPRDPTQGVYYGSDMWVWGREFLAREPGTVRQLEVDKHWLDWLTWGRFSYDPSLGNDRIMALVAERFPGVPADRLLAAWQHASMTYPLTTGFHWGQFDFQWYIEACKSRPEPAQTRSGFHDVNRFITLGAHPGTDNIAIPRFVAATLAGTALPGTSPLQVADQLEGHASAALAALTDLPDGVTGEWKATLADIRAMAELGRYYAHKIRGATELAFYRATGDAARQQAAIAELTAAAAAWRTYAGLVTAQYRNPLWTNRVGTVDWLALTPEVDQDIAIAREPRR